MIIDTHAHLYYPELLSDIKDVLSRAKDAGIEKIIVPAVDIQTSKDIVSLSEKYEMIYCALGIHPCEVKNNEIKSLDEIELLLNHEKVVAIGETGLDYYWDTSGTEKQKEFFTRQIGLAKAYKLPVIIHTRNSVEDAITIVKDNYDECLSGQFHCFSGSIEQLDKILELDNFYVSFCGNITYKNFGESDVILKCPVSRLLSETDSPFLTPVPHRGKKNEPSFIINTISKLSQMKDISLELLKEEMLTNAKKLYFSN